MIYTIIPNELYIGDKYSFVAVDFIKNTISIIIDCSEIKQPYPIPFLEYYNIHYIKSHTIDNEWFDVVLEFNRFASMSNEFNKKAVLICCDCAISRSVTYSIMYLMLYKKINLLHSFHLLKQTNNRMCPNIGFVKQLIMFEKSILKHNSVDLKQYIKCHFHKLSLCD